MTRSAPVYQTVILAAGFGSRLASAETGVPKPLLPVGGLPLIAHALGHAAASGCTEAVIVVGHEKERVRAAAESIDCGLLLRFVESPDPAAPNGVSLLAAEPAAAPRFFLQMVDHLFATAALPRLTATRLQDDEEGRLLVDPAPGAELDLADATKVRLASGRVTAIGKAVEPWDAIDAGCFVLTRAIFAALRGVGSTEPLTVSSGMRRLVAAHALGTATVDGIAWIDVDTPADRAVAERLMPRGSVVGAGAPSQFVPS